MKLIKLTKLSFLMVLVIAFSSSAFGANGAEDNGKQAEPKTTAISGGLDRDIIRRKAKDHANKTKPGYAPHKPTAAINGGLHRDLIRRVNANAQASDGVEPDEIDKD